MKIQVNLLGYSLKISIMGPIFQYQEYFKIWDENKDY